jgi:hypothetical protein
VSPDPAGTVISTDAFAVVAAFALASPATSIATAPAIAVNRLRIIIGLVPFSE